MADITPPWAEIFKTANETGLMDLRVCLPGTVQAYDASKQTVDVHLQIKRVLEDEDGNLVPESFPLLAKIPLMFPRGGGYFLSLPIQNGDNVAVFFCDFSIDQWRAQATETAPLDLTMHTLNGAFAVPGLYPANTNLSNADSSQMVIGSDSGAKIYVSSSQVNLYEKNASQFVALAQKTFDEINSLRTAVNNFVTIFNTHVHTGVTSGPGSTGTSPSPATAPSAVNSVASANVKAT